MTADGSVDLGLGKTGLYSAKPALVDLQNETGLGRAVEIEPDSWRKSQYVHFMLLMRYRNLEMWFAYPSCSLVIKDAGKNVPVSLRYFPSLDVGLAK